MAKLNAMPEKFDLEEPENTGEKIEIEVRLAGEEDLKKLKEIRLESLKNDPQAFGVSYEKELVASDDKWKERIARSKGENPTEFFVIAESNNIPIGIAGAYKSSACSWTIKAVYVNSKFRGKKISDNIMHLILNQIKMQKDVKTVDLHVSVDEAGAINLYKRFGFKISEITKDFKFGDSQLHDSYLMELEIKNEKSA